MSAVWEYFSKEGNKAKCGLCEAELSSKDGQTTSLKRHLSRFHDIDTTTTTNTKKAKKTDDSSTTASTSESMTQQQPKLQQFWLSKKSLPENSPKAQKLTYKVAKTMFVDLQPLLSVVEDIGFFELMAEAENRYVIPSCKKFTCNILPELYTKAASVVKAHIEEYQKSYGINCLFGVMTDAWTSGANQSFVTYTLHMVREYKIISYVICTKELPDSHTAENLKTDFLCTLKEWNVIPSKNLSQQIKEEKS